MDKIATIMKDQYFMSRYELRQETKKSKEKAIERALLEDVRE